MTSTLWRIVSDFSTTLNLKVAIWATTATLDSATDDDGVALPTWTYFLTLDRKSSNKEYIKCTLTSTALTSIQNVSRQWALTSGFARTHRKGATVEITDFAIIKKMLDLLDGTTDLNASVPLKYDGIATISNANHLATKDYVDWVAIAGGADASTTVKGISKLSYAPASASNPIAVGDNDPRVPTTGENDALVGTEWTPSGTNKYVTNDDTSATAVANKVARYSASGQLPWIPSQAFFGDGSDGDVVISSNTSLTRDMYYDDLTINNGITLSTKGYRIFVKGTLNCEWTGKIASNGWAGGAGAIGVNTGVAPAGGTAGGADYTGATLPTPKVWVVGGAGGGVAGNGTTGTAVTLNETMTSAVAGWAGGAGSSGSPGTGWAAGSAGSNPVMRPRTYQSAYNLYDLINSTITRHEIAPTGGSGGGGSGNGWNNMWGGGGGSGSTGGFISIFANIITNLNVEALGGAGGAGGATNIAPTGGGGWWAGGNGWFILIFYSTKTTVTATVTGGAGGAGWVATAPATNSGVAGTAGNAWVVLQIQI